MILEGLQRRKANAPNAEFRFVGAFTSKARAAEAAINDGAPLEIRSAPWVADGARYQWMISPISVDGAIGEEIEALVGQVSSGVQNEVQSVLTAYYGKGDHAEAAMAIAHRAIRSAWSTISDIVWAHTPVDPLPKKKRGTQP